MYPPSYFYLLVALLLIESTHGCSIDCGDDCACVAPEGLGSDCSGFRGCHKKCPFGTSILGCARTLANHTGNEKLLINRTTVSFLLPFQHFELKFIFCIFKESGPEFRENSDEREIKLNIRINVNKIQSENIGVDHTTPLSKLLTSNARKVEGKEKLYIHL